VSHPNLIHTYEIFVQREGRWVLDATLTDETKAMNHARGLLAKPGSEAAKIIRERVSPSGFRSESVIFEEKAPERGEEPVTLSGDGEGTIPCMSVDDLYGLNSRLAIRKLMPKFLDKLGITASELLHSASYARKFQDTGTLYMAAVSMVGSAQGRQMGIPAKDRVKALDGLLSEGLQRLLMFQTEMKKLPILKDGNLDFVWPRVRSRIEPAQLPFAFGCLLTQWLMGGRSAGHRMEMLLGLIRAEDTPPEAIVLLDGFLADTLAVSEVIADLFGQQPNLGSFLITLADLLNGVLEPDTPHVSPRLHEIGAFFPENRLPQCRDVLIRRLAQEITGRSPMDRTRPSNEQGLLDKLGQHLQDETGAPLGGEAVAKAMTVRKTEARIAVLRSLGMDEQANRLAKSLRQGDS